MQFLDAKGNDLNDVIQDGVAVLREHSTYRIALQLGEAARTGVRGWLGELELEWDSNTTSFLLQTSFWVGDQSLRIQGPAGEQHLPVRVLPPEAKLGKEAWAAWGHLLRDLDEWMPGSTVGREGGRHGEVGNTGCDVAGVASVLGDLVPAFVSALEAVLRAPRERSVEEQTEVPLHGVRQADRSTLRWLVRHPDAYQSVLGHTEGRREGREVLVPGRSWRGDLDHAANRYVAWLTGQVTLRLRQVAGCVRKALGKKKPASLDPDLVHWCEGRERWLLEGAEALEALLRRTALGVLTPEPASESAFLCLQDDPVYARVHALANIFRSPRFQLPEEADLLDAPVRPSYELYELWTFMAVQKLLAAHLPGTHWEKSDVDKLQYFDQSPNGACYSARLADRGTLELHFNLPFVGFQTKRRKTSLHWSLSGARRPDLVVGWRPAKGEGRWLCLDAKYRTDERALAESFESVHIYRDALRWRGMANNGRCMGAALLVPAQSSGLEEWFEKPFRDEHGAGIFRLTPGHPLPGELFEWIREQLGWEPT
jgi:hypothetical protein